MLRCLQFSGSIDAHSKFSIGINAQLCHQEMIMLRVKCVQKKMCEKFLSWIVTQFLAQARKADDSIGCWQQHRSMNS